MICSAIDAITFFSLSAQRLAFFYRCGLYFFCVFRRRFGGCGLLLSPFLLVLPPRSSLGVIFPASRFRPYLGTVAGGRRVEENGPAGGGFGFFIIFPAGGEALFAPGRGEGYCKIAKRALKRHFLREFWKFIQNMCNFPFLRHIFYYFYLQYGENFLFL